MLLLLPTTAYAGEGNEHACRISPPASKDGKAGDVQQAPWEVLLRAAGTVERAQKGWCRRTIVPDQDVAQRKDDAYQGCWTANVPIGGANIRSGNGIVERAIQTSVYFYVVAQYEYDACQAAGRQGIIGSYCARKEMHT
eukprot:scaffold28805_cov23-Tisochrysis_lutea.AAC.3